MPLSASKSPRGVFGCTSPNISKTYWNCFFFKSQHTDWPENLALLHKSSLFKKQLALTCVVTMHLRPLTTNHKRPQTFLSSLPSGVLHKIITYL